MNKDNTQRALGPELRFPEFRDAGPWTAKPLAEYCDRLTEKVGDAQLTPVSISAGIGFVSQKEKFGRDISGSQYSRYIRMQKGDFAYNRGNSKRFPQGCVYQLTEFDEAAASNAFHCFRLHPEHEPSFFEGLFESNCHGRQLIKDITSSARSDGLLNIRADTFFGIKIPMPPDKAEQRKIADCLGTLDHLIAAEGRKLAALRDHKKGLMQGLFPREGERQPRLRFPEFQGTAGWQTPQLSALYGFKRTNSLSRDQLNYEAGIIKNIHYGDIHTKFRTIFHLSHESVPYVNPEFAANSFDDDAYCEEGDIVLADASEDLNDVGKAIEIASLNGQPVVAGTHTILATRRSDEPAVGFGGYLFQSAVVRAGIKKEAQGAKVYGISARRISAISIPLPRTHAEQQRIANCLSTLDARIATQAEKFEALRTHKRGLMQQLFPSTEVS